MRELAKSSWAENKPEEFNTDNGGFFLIFKDKAWTHQ